MPLDKKKLEEFEEQVIINMKTCAYCKWWDKSASLHAPADWKHCDRTWSSEGDFKANSSATVYCFNATQAALATAPNFSCSQFSRKEYMANSFTTEQANGIRRRVIKQVEDFLAKLMYGEEEE